MYIFNSDDNMSLLVDSADYDDVLSDTVDYGADPMLILMAREELQAKCDELGIDLLALK